MIPRRWAHTYPGEWRDIARWGRRGLVTGGDALPQWEAAFARYVGQPYGAAVNSGRRAMGLILEHLGIGPGDEVIVPAYTFGEILPVFHALGVNTVPADVDPETFNMTSAAVAERITVRTRAILALHIFGAPCDIEGITALALRHGLPVVEDCAHSLGTTVGNMQTGCFGKAAFYSFEMTKLINTFGGGMVLTSDESLATRVRACNLENPENSKPLFRKVRATRVEQALFTTRLLYPFLYLMATPPWTDRLNRLYRHTQSALRSVARYTPIQAQLGLNKLATLGRRLAARRCRVELMRSLLGPDIHPQRVATGCQSSCYAFVVLLPCQAAPVRKRLLFRGIDAAVEHEIMDNCAAILGYEDCPVVSSIFPRLIALPMYDGLSERDAERVACALNAVL